MFRSSNSNTAATPFLNNQFQYSADASNLMQLHGNQVHGAPFLLPNKCGSDAEAIPRQQQFQFPLNNKSLNEEIDGKTINFGQNSVSTGLRLSCDDDERNSSITSASGSLTAASSVFSSLSNDISRELDQQKEELDNFIRTQAENMVKGVRDMRQRHTVSFLTTLEKGVLGKLREKDLELETITRKNKELVESMKHVTSEAQNWCYMAKYNESVVNVLKTNLQQAIKSSNRGKEEFGESNADDAASCIDPNNYLSQTGGSGRSTLKKKNLTCRSCKSKEVSVLLMPCRHLCLCKECEGFVKVCPVCQIMTTASFEVYLS